LGIAALFPPSLQKQAMADKQESDKNKNENPFHLDKNKKSCKSCPKKSL
jgi:hypothetical protein